jgi:phage shock protein A
MSILGRVADLFQAKTNKLLNALEDPNDSLDLSYEKMLTGLQETKRHLADVVAQQMSLERQMASADKDIEGAAADAATAVKAGRDDLARAALVHRRQLIDSRATLETAHDAIMPQVEKLAGYQRQLQDRIEKFRLQKDTMKAGYAAAQAQVKVTQSLTGTSRQLGAVDGAYRRAEDRMLGMRDKADAMDAMIAQGLLEDPLDKRTRDQREIADLRETHAVEDDLEMLKAHLQIGGAPANLALDAPEAKKET